MLTAFLILTDKCNIDCSFCLNHKKKIRSTTPNLDADNYKKIINILKENKVTHIILTGGEPLLLGKELNDIINFASKQGIKTLLLTNGEVLTADILKSLKKSGLNNISLSLNKLSILSKENNEFRNVVIEYQKKIKTILNYFHYVTLTVLMTNKNHKLLSTINNLFDNERTGLIFQPVYDKKLSLKKLSEEDWKELKLALYDWTEKYNKFNYLQIIYNMYNNIKTGNIDCNMGTYAFVINTDGNVYNCFHREDIMSGNILTTPPQKIFTDLISNSEITLEGNCFGEHCISLFYNVL